jgi:hypothetical protein
VIHTPQPLLPTGSLQIPGKLLVCIPPCPAAATLPAGASFLYLARTNRALTILALPLLIAIAEAVSIYPVSAAFFEADDFTSRLFCPSDLEIGHKVLAELAPPGCQAAAVTYLVFYLQSLHSHDRPPVVFAAVFVSGNGLISGAVCYRISDKNSYPG